MTSQDLEALLSRAGRGDGLLVDANLLLVFLLGEVDRKWIEQFKRTCAFSSEDYLDLCSLVLPLQGKLYTTPSVLTEVSNLANAIERGNPRRTMFFSRFAQMVQHQLTEVHEPSASLTRLPRFDVYGLTDQGLVHLSKRLVVVTDDGPLAFRIGSEGGFVIEWQSIRALRIRGG